jgi:hypothetical protein
LNIGAVMPSFIQEVEKEAYLMIKKYGKENAEKIAIGYANDWIKNINTLPYYDKDKVSSMDIKKWYWLTVASAIKNWA